MVAGWRGSNPRPGSYSVGRRLSSSGEDAKRKSGLLAGAEDLRSFSQEVGIQAVMGVTFAMGVDSLIPGCGTAAKMTSSLLSSAATC